MQAWNGDARLGILESPDPDRWQWVLPGPETEIWMDNWAIAAGAPHPEAAHAFIDYVLTPENALAELDYIGYHTGATDIEQAAAEARAADARPRLLHARAARDDARGRGQRGAAGSRATSGTR